MAFSSYSGGVLSQAARTVAEMIRAKRDEEEAKSRAVEGAIQGGVTAVASIWAPFAAPAVSSLYSAGRATGDGNYAGAASNFAVAGSAMARSVDLESMDPKLTSEQIAEFNAAGGNLKKGARQSDATQEFNITKQARDLKNAKLELTSITDESETQLRAMVYADPDDAYDTPLMTSGLSDLPNSVRGAQSSAQNRGLLGTPYPGVAPRLGISGESAVSPTLGTGAPPSATSTSARGVTRFSPPAPMSANELVSKLSEKSNVKLNPYYHGAE